MSRRNTGRRAISASVRKRTASFRVEEVEPGALALSGSDGVYVVHREGTPSTLPLGTADALRTTSQGNTTVLVNTLVSDTEISSLPGLLAPVREACDRTSSRLVRLVMSSGAADRGEQPGPARHLCEAWGIDMVAPSGLAVIIPGGSLFAPDGLHAPGGWWHFSPGLVPRRLGARLPTPTWDAALERIDHEVAEGHLVQSIPAGLLVQPHNTPPQDINALRFAVPVDPDGPIVLVGVPGAPAVSGEALASLLAALPRHVRHSVRLVPGDGHDLLSVGQEVADALGAEVHVSSGLPVILEHDSAVPAMPRTLLMGSGGSPSWQPYVEAVTCVPADDGSATPPRLTSWRSPAAGLEDGPEPGVFLLDRRWQVALNRTGLWIGPRGRRPPANSSQLIDNDVMSIAVGVPGQALDASVWPALERLFESLADEVREYTVIRVLGSTDAQGIRTLRRLAVRHGLALAPKGWRSTEVRQTAPVVSSAPLNPVTQDLVSEAADEEAFFPPTAPTIVTSSGTLSSAGPVKPIRTTAVPVSAVNPSVWEGLPAAQDAASASETAALAAIRESAPGTVRAQTPSPPIEERTQPTTSTGSSGPPSADFEPPMPLGYARPPQESASSLPEPVDRDIEFASPAAIPAVAKEQPTPTSHGGGSEHAISEDPWTVAVAAPFASWFASADDGDSPGDILDPYNAAPVRPAGEGTDEVVAADREFIRPDTSGTHNPVADSTGLDIASASSQPREPDPAALGVSSAFAASDADSPGSEGPHSPAPLREVHYVPVLPAHHSDIRARDALRELLGEDWDRHLGAVQRALTRFPGLRADHAPHDLAADLAAVHAYLIAENGQLSPGELTEGLARRDAGSLAFLSCLASGLRRLPSYRGPAMRSAGFLADSADLLLPGEELGEATAVSALAVDKQYPAVPEDHYLIWSMTGRRTDAMTETESGDTAEEVLFGPGTRFRLLQVRQRAGARVLLLREIPETMPLNVPGVLDENDLKALDRLNAVVDGPAALNTGRAWPSRCAGALGVLLPAPGMPGAE
ncbi:hypothetical protein ABZ379_43065 [Streptomyces canus]|uniref:hypothetical protein n=1 Tax=Streptomyces canus TaxID=58343 RepID=UPI0033E0C907